jgi:hypothetical protein
VVLSDLKHSQAVLNRNYNAYFPNAELYYYIQGDSGGKFNIWKYDSIGNCEKIKFI